MSRSLIEEEKRCHWRDKILSGKLGTDAKKRLLASVLANLPERFCI